MWWVELLCRQRYEQRGLLTQNMLQRHKGIWFHTVDKYISVPQCHVCRRYITMRCEYMCNIIQIVSHTQPSGLLFYLHSNIPLTTIVYYISSHSCTTTVCNIMKWNNFHMYGSTCFEQGRMYVVLACYRLIRSVVTTG